MSKIWAGQGRAGQIKAEKAKDRTCAGQGRAGFIAGAVQGEGRAGQGQGRTEQGQDREGQSQIGKDSGRVEHVEQGRAGQGRDRGRGRSG